jgi:hypothetical protein
MWPFKKEITYTEKELDIIIKIVRKDLLQEAIAVSLEVKTVREAVKRMKGLMTKYETNR